MFSLHMDPKAFGLAHAKTVRSRHGTLDEAKRQAAHNLAIGKCKPLFITDDAGATVFDFGDLSKADREQMIEHYRAQHKANRVERLALVS